MIAKSRKRTWAAIREFTKKNKTNKNPKPAFSTLDIEDIVFKDDKGERVSVRTMKRYMGGLTKAGFILRANDTLNDHEWFLARDIGRETPHVDYKGNQLSYGCMYKQLWNTMRIIREFTSQELVINASTEECPINTSTCKQYITHLRKAGYLAPVGKKPRNAYQRLRLLPSMNTGPHAPSFEQYSMVRDNNTGEVVWREDES